MYPGCLSVSDGGGHGAIRNKRRLLASDFSTGPADYFQNLINTAVNSADVLMLGFVSQTALSASSLANRSPLH